jgi:hypothetical protein
MYRTALEEDKPEEERGTYLRPEAYGLRTASGKGGGIFLAIVIVGILCCAAEAQ